MKTKFVFIMLALTLSHTVTKAIRGEPLSSCEARAIAKEAYIYGFPLVDSYRILYSYFVDRSSPEHKAGWKSGRIHKDPGSLTTPKLPQTQGPC